MAKPSCPSETSGDAVFKLLADHIPAVMWSTDDQLRFTSSLGAGLAVLGLKPGEVVGSTIFEYFGADDPKSPPIDAHLRALEGEAVSFEHIWGGRTFQVYLEPLVDGRSQVVGCVGIAHDITQRKEAEDALRKAHGDLERRVRERTAELTKTNRRLRQQIAIRRQAEAELRDEHRVLRQLLRAHDRDRQLIAYEIHDGLSQYLSAAMMYFETFGRLKDSNPGEARQNFEAGIDTLCKSIVEARRLISGVRPPLLDQSGVVAAVEALVAESRRRGGPEIELSTDVTFDRLEPALENVIYRVAQEGLTNALRYSKSKRIRLAIVQAEGRVRVTIEDWGVGFSPEAVEESHFGIEGIRQRARSLGGTAHVDSTPGEGTTVTVDLPLVTDAKGA